MYHDLQCENMQSIMVTKPGAPLGFSTDGFEAILRDRNHLMIVFLWLRQTHAKEVPENYPGENTL